MYTKNLKTHTPPDAMRPLGRAAHAYTTAVWPRSSDTISPLKAHTLTVKSWEADTKPTPGSTARALYER